MSHARSIANSNLEPHSPQRLDKQWKHHQTAHVGGLVWPSKGPLRVGLRSLDKDTHVVVPLWPDCVSQLAGQASYECQPLMML
jgi:hypothetical protein